MVANRRPPHCLPPHLPHHEKAKGLLVSARHLQPWANPLQWHVAACCPRARRWQHCPPAPQIWRSGWVRAHSCMCLGAGVASGVCVSSVESSGAVCCAFELSSTLSVLWCQLSPQSPVLPSSLCSAAGEMLHRPCEGLPMSACCLAPGTAR